jgi:NitT/TauT family transport system permease protein
VSRSIWIDALLFAALALAAWQGLYAVAGEVALSSPAETVVALGSLLRTRQFWPHVEESGRALALAAVIASAGGLALGASLGSSRLATSVGEPILVSLSSLPKITLYPLILLLFGLGPSAKVAFGAIHGIVPVTLFTLNAVRNIRPVLIKASRTMRLSGWETALHVVVPAALPEIFSGLRMGFGLTLLGVLIGEMFASQRGLGFLVMRAIGLNDVPTMMAVTLLIVVFAVAVSVLLLDLDRRLHRGRAAGG